VKRGLVGRALERVVHGTIGMTGCIPVAVLRVGKVCKGKLGQRLVEGGVASAAGGGGIAPPVEALSHSRRVRSAGAGAVARWASAGVRRSSRAGPAMFRRFQAFFIGQPLSSTS
jgi:hypothetical protein